MRRELFIYWRTAVADAPAACNAVRAWQEALQAPRPDLRPRLLQRTDAHDGHATLMETYAIDGGIDATLQLHIVEAGNAVTAPWRQGARHVEVFEALESFEALEAVRAGR